MAYPFKALAKRIQEPRRIWEEENLVAEHEGVWYRIYEMLNPGELPHKIRAEFPYEFRCVMERIEESTRNRLKILALLSSPESTNF